MPHAACGLVALSCCVKEEETSEALQAEFDAFNRFLMVPFFGAQSDPVTAVTAAKYADHMR